LFAFNHALTLPRKDEIFVNYTILRVPMRHSLGAYSGQQAHPEPRQSRAGDDLDDA